MNRTSSGVVKSTIDVSECKERRQIKSDHDLMKYFCLYGHYKSKDKRSFIEKWNYSREKFNQFAQDQ
jgi:hypothetical protein